MNVFKRMARAIDNGKTLVQALRDIKDVIFDGDVDIKGAFTSLGIDDNATSTAITIDASENVALKCSAGSANYSLEAYHPTGTSSRLIARFQSNVGGTQTNQVTIDCTGNIATLGNVSLADNKYLYLGTGNDFQIVHNGNARIYNYTGIMTIVNRVNSSQMYLQTYDSAGTIKTGVQIGGEIPKVSLYGNGVVHFSTKASSTYRTINFPAIPTTSTGLSAGDVWSNAGVLTIV